MIEHIDDSNFLLFAAQHYDNINCVDTDEFEDDIKRIKYIKKLFKKYRESDELRERLILNHIIILYNIFTPQACTEILCYKLKDYLDYLKPFLLFLNYWPTSNIINIDNVSILNSYIQMDQHIIEKLREI